jgi:hypothetical protein
MDLEKNRKFCLSQHYKTGFYNRSGLFTARYAQSPYITQIRFVLKRLITTVNPNFCTYNISFKYLGLIPFNVGKKRKILCRVYVTFDTNKRFYPAPAKPTFLVTAVFLSTMELL